MAEGFGKSWQQLPDEPLSLCPLSRLSTIRKGGMAAASMANLFCALKPGHLGSSLSFSWEGDPWAQRGAPMNVLEQLFEFGNWQNSWIKNGLKG